MNIFRSLFRLIVVLSLFLWCMIGAVYGQVEPKVEHQIWFFSYNYFKIKDRIILNQDFAYQQSLMEPYTKQLFVRSQFNYSFSSVLSLHAGLSVLYELNKHTPNHEELRPWQGIKLRWPSLWRLDFSHYVRFEERFERLQFEKSWSSRVRFRYKLSTTIPINKSAITDHTLYLVFGYEYLANSFNRDFINRPTDYHRFDAGSGFRFNQKSRVEALVIYIDDFDPIREKYAINSVIFQFKYYHYFNF